MITLGTVLTAVAVALAVLLLVGPDLWLLFDMARERGLRATRVRLRDGPVGETAKARRDFVARRGVSRGPVFVDGEVWTAECANGAAVRAGDELRITGRRGLTLLVENKSAAP